MPIKGPSIGSSGGGGGVTDHGALTGLTDDDHSIYALLAGRAGGQTIIGGTASGDDLTLQTTSHATRGTIIFGSAGNSGYDEINDRLGIGTTAPDNPLTITGASAGGIVSEIRNTTDGAASSTLFRMGNDAAANLLELRLTASSYTPSGYLKASGVSLTGEGAGGLSLGATNASGDIRLYSGGNADANERLTVLSTGETLVGSTTSVTMRTVAPSLQVLGTGGADSSFGVGKWSADAFGPSIYLTKSRNATIGSNTIVQSGDVCGSIGFCADDGTNTGSLTAQILAIVDGTPGENDTPGRLTFLTTADGAESCSERLRITSDGKLSTNAEAAPDAVTGGLTRAVGTETGKFDTVKRSDIAHGLTTYAETDTFFSTQSFGAGGGAIIQSITDGDETVSAGLALRTFVRDTADTTTSILGRACIELFAFQHDGANTASAVAAAGNVLTISNAGVARVIFKGDGDVEADGTVTSTSYDFAEYFESTDGTAIDNGTPVVLVGKKIRAAIEGETPMGVVSATAAFIGNQGLDWQGRYLIDNFGAIQHDADGHPIDNPDYDPEQEFVSRKDRPEWNIVGLVGQVYVKKGAPVNPNWILMEDANEEAYLYLIK